MSYKNQRKRFYFLIFIVIEPLPRRGPTGPILALSGSELEDWAFYVDSCDEGEWGSLLSFLGETAQGSLVPSILRN